KYRLANDFWESLGNDEAWIEKIEAEKIRRVRDGSFKRELAQKHIVRGPDVLSNIMDDPAAGARNRVNAIKTLDDLAANGPERTPMGDRFIIQINLGADTEIYNKSIKVDANDIDPNDTPAIPAIAAKKSQDDGNGGQNYF